MNEKFQRRTVTVTRREYVVDTAPMGAKWATGVELASAIRAATQDYRMTKGGAAANLNVDVSRAIKVHTNGDEVIIWFEVREETSDR